MRKKGRSRDEGGTGLVLYIVKNSGKYTLIGMGVMLEYNVVDGKLKMAMEGQPEALLTPLSQSEFKYEGVEATIIGRESKVAEFSISY